MTEQVQAMQVTHCQQALKVENDRRLRVKIGFLATGAVIGALFVPPQGLAAMHPIASRIAGAMVGEMVAWVAHGITQKRWFI